MLMLALTRCRWRPPPNVFLRSLQTVKDTEAMKDVKNLIDTLADAPPVGGPDGYGAPNGPNITRVSKKPTPDPMSQKDQKDYAQKKPLYRLYCQATRNNTITTLVDEKCQPLVSFSGGSCGFKGVNRAGYEAGYQCAVHIFRFIEGKEKAVNEKFDLHLFLKGFGQGRDAMHNALLTAEGRKVKNMIKAITDKTPIKIGGTRAKKTRRL